MPYKTNFPLLPFLDPRYDTNHPQNHIKPIVEDPYLPLKPLERQKLQREAMKEALANYTPSHVPRSWETDSFRANRHQEILAFVLHPRPANLNYRPNNPRDSSLSRLTNSPYDPNSDQDLIDFRRFAEKRLHLGYWRFHPSTEPQDDEIGDPPETAPEEICWIMEYRPTECNTIRRQIALALGLFPASIDPENQFYNEEMEYSYNRRLLTRCRRRHKFCVRPSHIEIFTSSGLLLP